MVDSFATLVISNTSPYPALRKLSRLAHQPFELDSQRYASLQALWLSLQLERKRDAFLWKECVQQHGPDAAKFAELCRKRAARNGGVRYYYFDSEIKLVDALRQLERAMRAQLHQAGLKDALLATRGHELQDGDKDTGIDTFSPEEFTRVRLKVREELAHTDGTKSRPAGTRHDLDASERTTMRIWSERFIPKIPPK